MPIVHTSCVHPRSTSMPKQLIRILSILMVSALAMGCLSMQSYGDPTLPSASFEDLKPSPSPQPVQLLFEFQSNRNSYQHASYSTIGGTKGPNGLEPMKTADAYKKGFEQLLLNLLKALSLEGLL